MGGSGSRLEKENISAYGLENFGNTCYCNSVLQALYYCQPFRRRVLEYLQEHEKDAYKASEDDTSLLMCLAELFHTISISKKKQGVIAPRKFVSKVKKENELFRSFMHQDAHEFLNYLLNEIDEQLKKEARERPAVPPEPPSHGKRGRSNSIRLPPLAAPPTVPHDGDARPPTAPLPHPTSAPILHTLADGRGTPPVSAAPPPSSAGDGEQRTWIHEIFQGVLTSETRCLNCEATTCRDERTCSCSETSRTTLTRASSVARLHRPFPRYRAEHVADVLPEVVRGGGDLGGQRQVLLRDLPLPPGGPAPHAGEAAAAGAGPPPEALQVHRAAAAVQEALLPRRLPPRAEGVQRVGGGGGSRPALLPLRRRRPRRLRAQPRPLRDGGAERAALGPLRRRHCRAPRRGRHPGVLRADAGQRRFHRGGVHPLLRLRGALEQPGSEELERRAALFSFSVSFPRPLPRPVVPYS